MRDILSEYGEDTPKPQASRATEGGVTQLKSLPYQPPVGPIGIMSTSHRGLGGHNCGKAGSQGASSLYGDGASGAPGIVRLGGDNYGNDGSQHG